MKKLKLILTIVSLLIIGSLSTYAIVQESSSEWTVTKTAKCKRCDGKGYMTIKKNHGPCSGNGCSQCDYKGYTETRVQCSACEGTGYITTKTSH